MRKINDFVWCARFEPHTQIEIECPDCAGTGRCRVILADDSVISVHCESCARGYDAPTGKQTIYDNKVISQKRYIIEIKQTVKGLQYLMDNHHTHTDENIFDNEADALAYGEKKRKEYITEQEKKIFCKEKPLKTWLWNASYHRRQIKDCENKLKYHTAKLNAANLKVKS